MGEALAQQQEPLLAVALALSQVRLIVCGSLTARAPRFLTQKGVSGEGATEVVTARKRHLPTKSSFQEQIRHSPAESVTFWQNPYRTGKVRQDPSESDKIWLSPNRAKSVTFRQKVCQKPAKSVKLRLRPRPARSCTYFGCTQ